MQPREVSSFTRYSDILMTSGRAASSADTEGMATAERRPGVGSQAGCIRVDSWGELNNRRSMKVSARVSTLLEHG